MDNDVIWVSLTALASWALVVVTAVLVWRQLRVAREDLGIRLQTNYEEKFDSQAMVLERKQLARQLLNEAPHGEIQEPVMNFFESLGMLHRRGYLDLDMTWSMFGFYAIRWWTACEDYVANERRMQGEDKTIFNEFKLLAKTLIEYDARQRKLKPSEAKPSRDERIHFLETEMNL